jgi:hypothetical protein
MPETPTDAGKLPVAQAPGTARLAAPAELQTPPPLPCANCGAVLTGPYCARCGQHIADYHRSVWRFVADFFSNTFSWDNRLLLTIEPLFLQPGFLTREFMVGRRVRYVHPLRLFLFTSAVCLTLLQFSYDHRARRQTHDRQAAAEKEEHFKWVEADTPQPIPIPEQPEPQLGDHKAKDNVATKTAASPSSAGEDQPKERGAEDDLGERIGQAVNSQIAKNGGSERTNKAISDDVQRKLSWVALALLPVFALLLQAMYRRQDSFYFGHLVFSLHYHTFLLFFWTAYVYAGIIAAELPFHWLTGLSLRLSLLLPLVYLFLALRLIYGGSSRRTFVKALVIGSMHLLTIFISLAICGAVSFFTAQPVR